MDSLYQYLSSKGIIIPDTGSVLTTVQDDFKALFGDDLSTEPSTPQGRLIEAFARYLKASVGFGALCANQLDLSQAHGVFLDSLASIFGITRRKATYTTVSAQLSGVSGSTVPAGSLASAGGKMFALASSVQLGALANASLAFVSVPPIDSTVTVGDTTYTFLSSVETENSVLLGLTAEDCANNLVAALQGGAGRGSLYADSVVPNTAVSAQINAATILLDSLTEGSLGDLTPLSASDLAITVVPFSGGSAGNATGLFVAQDEGQIPCPVGALNTVVSSAIGWETVLNSTRGELGGSEETDEELRARVKASRFSGVATEGAVYSAVAQVNGVLSVFVKDNGTNAPIAIGDKFIAAHSLLVVVNGGSDSDIANAIYANRSGGCGLTSFSGQAVSVFVTDPITGNVHEMRFNRPAYVPITLAVSVKYTGTLSQADVTDEVKKFVAAWANGEYDGTALALGETISPYFFGQPLQDDIPGLSVQSISCSRDGNPLSTAPITIQPYEVATIAPGNISVSFV